MGMRGEFPRGNSPKHVVLHDGAEVVPPSALSSRLGNAAVATDAHCVDRRPPPGGFGGDLRLEAEAVVLGLDPAGPSRQMPPFRYGAVRSAKWDASRFMGLDAIMVGGSAERRG